MTFSERVGDEERVFRRPADIEKADLITECTVIKKTYTQQFSQIYFCRLRQLIQALKEAACAKWKTGHEDKGERPFFCERIIELITGRDSVIFGTIYGDLTSKPNVLEEIEKDSSAWSYTTPDSYLGTSDVYYAEDESGRIELCFETQQKEAPMITGMCVALRGKEGSDGKFHVTSYCLTGVAPVSLPRPVATKESPESYAVLVSGIEFGESGALNDIATDLFMDFLMGNLASLKTVDVARISSVVFAGNTFCRPERTDDTSKKRYGSENVQYDLEPFRRLDEALYHLAQSLSVVIIPGPSDPTSLALPQSAIKAGVLPLASKIGAFRSFPNPSSFEIDALRFVVSSGQGLDDMARYTKDFSRLALAEFSLACRHLCPSAPDTLWCYPFYESDPFVLSHSPHCYVIGNQPSFESSIVKDGNGEDINVILVPSFKVTKSCVLLSLSEGTCQQIFFG